MTLLDDWLAQAGGRAEFDAFHFARLLFEHGSPAEIATIAGVFPGGGRVAERILDLFASNRGILSLGAFEVFVPKPENAAGPDALAALIERHVRGLRSFFESVGEAKLAAEIPQTARLVATAEVDAALRSYAALPHARALEVVGDAFAARFTADRDLCFALEEAAYNLTLNYEVAYWLLAPLNATPLAFDDAYAFWKAGGVYAIARDAVLIARR